MFTIADNLTEVTDTSKELKVGDIVYARVKCKYNYLWTRAIIASLAEKEINKSKNYEYLSVNYNDDPDGYFWFKLKVIADNPELQLASVGNLILMFLGMTIVGLAVWNSPKIFKSIENAAIALSSNPELASDAINSVNEAESSQKFGTQVQKAGIGIAIPIVAVAIILYLWKRR